MSTVNRWRNYLVLAVCTFLIHSPHFLGGVRKFYKIKLFSQNWRNYYHYIRVLQFNFKIYQLKFEILFIYDANDRFNL